MGRGKQAAVLLLLAAGSAHALECREDREERLAQLAKAFDDEVTALHIWSWSWGSIYAAAAVAQGGIALGVKDRDTRIDLAVGSVTAAIGSASLFLLPLRFTRPMTELRSRWSDPDRCRLLAEAEELLVKVAKEERTGKSWVGHVGNVLFNVGITLVLGLGFHHWKAGLIAGGIGIAVGELNLWTQPTRLGAVIEQPTVAVVPLMGEVNGLAVRVAF